MDSAPTRPQPRDDISVMEGYHSPQVDVSVRLNTNESPLPPPPGFAEAVAHTIEALAWNRYPDRAARGLRAALAKRHGVNPEQIFAANGSNEVLQTLLLAYTGPGRKVLTFEPTYALHSHVAAIVGAETHEAERDANYELTPDYVADTITSMAPMVTFLCSPNNPTGVVEPQAVIDAALDAVVDIGGLLVVDEAYAEFAPYSVIGHVNDDQPLVVTRTFSKTWSMAAARLGYAVAPSWVVSVLEHVVLPYHLNALVQTAGTVALGYVDEMDARVGAIIAERERTSTALSEMGLVVWPSSSNFVLFRSETHSGNDLWQALVDRDVLVRNCATWPRLDDCLRVTIGTESENDAFLAALAAILAP